MSTDRLGFLTKVELAVRIWILFFGVVFRLRRQPLPLLLDELGRVEPPHRIPLSPRRLGRVVHRSLAVGPHKPRCLTSSLVLYRLLCEQGAAPQLVIGLPHLPTDKDAHAWVELDGVDVGPPPGRAGHHEMARYG